ncbi:MAG TPA: protein kinase [Polyangia bacterium]|nr:protein kinase [Polyangia bacterium]
MSGSDSRDKDSITEVASDEPFVRERPPDIERGTVLAGRYQIEDIIGKGGSGVVLRVFDRTAQTLVALKVLKAELARDAKWEKRFSRELRLGRPIQHPHVCRIFDIGEADGHRFLTMELARGGSLRDELKRRQAIERPIEERLADAKAVIAGLAALHSSGVVHRDFKPDNILRMEDGRLILSDFGLATDAATAPGVTVLIGTPHYMAPEVLAGEPATTRSDVWALGVVLHELFFGVRPERRSMSFDGTTRVPLRPQSSTERRMLALCETCLAESPFDRPLNAEIVAQLFERRPVHRSVAKRLRLKKIGAWLSVIVGASTLALWEHGRRAGGPAVGRTSPPRMISLAPVGEPIDWSKDASVVADISGRVYCFSLLGGETARLVWGTPRQVEDLNLVSGERHPAEWLPEVYRYGCPELSPDGKNLLFTAPNKAGAMEIRLSSSRNGSLATELTSGADPVWLGGTDGFLYSVDNSHVAMFSLSTMTSTFLPSPGFGEHQRIAAKVANSAGTAIAELLYDDKAEAIAAVLNGNLFEDISAFSVPSGTTVQFSDAVKGLLISLPAMSTAGGVVSVDWHRNQAINIARYSGFEFVALQRFDRGEVAVVHRRAKDVWLHGDGPDRRLTFDGRNYTAAMSTKGILLLSRRTDAGAFAIWRQVPDGGFEQLTNGPGDVEPSFSRDGKQWTYADYSQMSVMVCSIEARTCRVLRRDGLLPGWPTFSPDGESIAYVTQLNRPQLKVISTRDGMLRSSWDAHPECSPVWSSDTTLWSLESSAGKYSWSERDVTGRRTGKSFVGSSDSLEPGEVRCSPKGVMVGSPWFQRVEIKNVDTSKVLIKPAQ